MNELLLLGALLLCWRVARGGDAASPASVMVFICGASMMVFYGVTILWIYPEWVSSWWQVRNDYRDVATSVLLFYFGLLVLAFAVERATGRVERLALPYGTDLRSQVQFVTNLDKLLLHPAFVMALVGTGLLCVWHRWAVDFGQLTLYHVYTSVRDPLEVGITNPIVALFHKNLPMVGCILGPITMLYFHRRKLMTFALVAPQFLYALVVTISFCSRFAVLQLFLMTILAHILSKRRVSPAAVSLGIATFVTYAVIIMLRKSLAAERVGPLGIQPFIQILLSGNFLFDQMLLFTLFNNFGGGFVLAEAMSRAQVAYPLAYKILSFSPFPSILDGFNSVRYAEERVMETGPFNNFAELYHFGPMYLIGFLVFLAGSLYLLTRWWRMYRGGFAFVVVAPMYYALFSMHYYPLRHSTRWILASTLVAIVISRKYEKRDLARARSRTRVPVFAGHHGVAPGGWRQTVAWRNDVTR
jgi:hypothetical protein